MNAVSGISGLLMIVSLGLAAACSSEDPYVGCIDTQDCVDKGNSCPAGEELFCNFSLGGICDCEGGAGGTGGTGGTCGEGCGSPSDFSGTWTGTYECTFRDALCGEPFGGDITLMVTQNGCAATYSDEEATYEGSVCGNVFEFEGGGPGYTESGTLTLVTPNEATKESTFVNTGDSCTGDCADVLSRQP